VVGLSAGADDYVARPFVAEELRARVNAALRARELADASKHERRRLAAVNRLAQALLRVGDTRGILDALAFVLVCSLCDGCVITIEGDVVAVRHRVTASEAFTEVLPLPASSPVRGTVTVTRDATGQPFESDDIATFETCIEYCSLAIQNALRLEAERVAHAQRDAVLQSLPVGILVTDVAGALTLVNAAASALLPNVAAAPNLAAAFQLAEWRTLAGTPIDEGTWGSGTGRRQMILATPGREVTVAVSAVALLDGHNEPAGAVTVIEDVSAERAISAERERIARFQEEMVAIVGHDLRGPLGAFVAGTDLLRSIASDYPDLMPIVQRMQSSAHRMTKMVEQLLDVTHARLGKGIPLAVRSTSLRDVLETVIGESTLAAPHMRFELRADDDVQGIWDPDRLAQVVANLTNNAVHYGHAGKPVVIALDVSNEAATIRVQNTVRDLPIPPELLATLFDPFRRGRSLGNAGGLGLGLYIVREIVQAHGGTIEVASDELTVFRIVLPRQRG
ncbi:MAG TPA: hybrid sensor histidine kinase/response regulator, partial [Kofleriaceae bacterium]|nr:hybrid sensor histidine kinase/response regulator [Kofleriaceae bacterium]